MRGGGAERVLRVYSEGLCARAPTSAVGLILLRVMRAGLF